MFDRVVRAGAMFGMAMAGQEALETLMLEAGVPLPGVDYEPARDDAAAEPVLQSLMPLPPPPAPPRVETPPPAQGETDATGATEKPAEDTAPAAPAPASPAQVEGTVLAGIEIDGDVPLPFAPVLVGGTLAGHTLRSAWSPTLRRAIALAQLPAKHATPGMQVVVMTTTVGGPSNTQARVSALPFL
jgi:glycine cleavage system aminomethyltransferase T